MRIAWVALATASFVAAALPASAQTPKPPDTKDAKEAKEAKQKAGQLFEEAKKLMNDKNFAEACPKLVESFELDPAVGTCMNTALCFDKLGKLATSYQWYEKAAGMAERAKQDKRVEFARKELQRLDGQAAKILVRADKPAPGMKVVRGETPVTAGTPERVDAGAYEIVATAEQRLPFKKTVTAVDGQTVTVEIPELAPVEKPPEPPPPPVADTSQRRKQRLLIAYIVGGGGAAFTIVGLSFGLAASSAWGDARALCPEGSLACSPAARDLADTAGTRADVATVFTTVGVLALGAGVALYLTAPKAETLTVAPAVSKNGFGLFAAGRF